MTWTPAACPSPRGSSTVSADAESKIKLVLTPVAGSQSIRKLVAAHDTYEKEVARLAAECEEDNG
eukprot:4275965-Alexandrium_andersonii.AAC.1